MAAAGASPLARVGLGSQPRARGIVHTRVPGRLDRLPWSRFHWRVVAGLGTVWILDGLEVTIVGSIASRLTARGSGVGLTASGIGVAAAVYVAGACCGSLVFGQLTDRHGRKRLMILTLALYVSATAITALSFAPWFFFLCRFFTGAGIGGEYSAINSAIDELIPARNRGQVDITINGSYWVGSGIGGLAALLFLDESIFAVNVGWRLAFAVGAVLGVLILLVRRALPESPRWLVIHGHEDEAEDIVDGIEKEVRRETGGHAFQDESTPVITLRQREAIPFHEIARVAWRFYPNRFLLGLALFIGQAFLYNAVTFDLGTMLSNFFGVSSGTTPVFFIVFAAGNFLGPLLLGRLFDTLGRKPMITGTYLGSSALIVLLGVLLIGGGLNRWSFIAVVGIAFFFASAGASAAYLTVSEIFPMETRALAIAFFYAIGTATGGIVGPLLFGNLIEHGAASAAIGFFVGAAVMAVGGVAELLLGVRAERQPLENIAKPLTVADAEAGVAPLAAASGEGAAELHPEHLAALRAREQAEEERARAAEHRAAAHEAAAAAALDGRRESADRQRVEEVLAEIAELRARSLDEQALAHEERANADRAGDDAERKTALDRSQAAQDRARVYDERSQALAAEHRDEARRHDELSQSAMERARAAEQRAMADEARARIRQGGGLQASVGEAEAAVHDAWAERHAALASVHALRAEGKEAEARRAEQDAAAREQQALAAEARLEAARHRLAASTVEEQEGVAERRQREGEAAEESERSAREREERIRQRLAALQARERRGWRRFRPGPGHTLYSPGWIGTASHWLPAADGDLDREVEQISRALADRGPLDSDQLEEAVGARYWGPGRWHAALRAAVEEGHARRLSRTTYGPGDPAP